MAESSLARSAQESPELAKYFRHEGDECPRCDGSGFRPRKHCAECGEPSGSISKGTGFPLVRDKKSERWFHVRCQPGFEILEAHWSCPERMGG
jgi:hypothetical protein